MAGRKSDFTLPTNTLDELFSTQENNSSSVFVGSVKSLFLPAID